VSLSQNAGHIQRRFAALGCEGVGAASLEAARGNPRGQQEPVTRTATSECSYLGNHATCPDATSGMIDSTMLSRPGH
jgi:hypothetical protein